MLAGADKIDTSPWRITKQLHSVNVDRVFHCLDMLSQICNTVFVVNASVLFFPRIYDWLYAGCRKYVCEYVCAAGCMEINGEGQRELSLNLVKIASQYLT